METTERTKRFIAPGTWFAMSYPATWQEAEDEEGVFLFYDPITWSGNFRISAFRGDEHYGGDVVRHELSTRRKAVRKQIGGLTCAYTADDFAENENEYTDHHWTCGKDNMVFEVSFATIKGKPVDVAEKVIASLEVRHDGVKYPAEVIPLRLLEMARIEQANEQVRTLLKEKFSRNYRIEEDDIATMQQLVEHGMISPKKQEAWLSLGIALCSILEGEADGFEWRTLIDGNREEPVLWDGRKASWIDPMKLTWSKARKGEPVDLIRTYEELTD